MNYCEKTISNALDALMTLNILYHLMEWTVKKIKYQIVCMLSKFIKTIIKSIL